MPALPEIPLLPERQRLEELERLRILDTHPDPFFDQLVDVAARYFDAPIALISLVDGERQWFKAKTGLPVSQTPREQAFCAHTILSREPFIVPDATRDERFQQNPLVTGYPHIRFYAGAPLITDTGAALGSLCVIDTKARQSFRPQDIELLKEAAAIAMRLINLVND